MNIDKDGKVFALTLRDKKQCLGRLNEPKF
nr:MAG TPA: hypothetical protein [Caudoviricetes sp.]